MNEVFKTGELPMISVVIIGINVEKYLGACIDAVRAADYPQQKIEIIFVDGGSSDLSVKIATDFEGVKVIELNDPHPTPGRGRNAGYGLSSGEYIQFLDADTEMDPQWLKKALSFFEDRSQGQVMAVCGRRSEKYPQKNFYHKLGNIEWIYEYGPCRYFGGDVLIKREAMEVTHGYDGDLVAGEDPELSYRVRQWGGTILRVDEPMTTHDLNMTRFRQYWRRSYRTGYAYAEVGLRHAKREDKMWLREFLRIMLRSALPIILFLILAAFSHPFWGLGLAALLIVKPFKGLRAYRRRFGLSFLDAVKYSAHLSFVIFPQALGAWRYLWGRVFHRPLLNQGAAPQPMESPPKGVSKRLRTS